IVDTLIELGIERIVVVVGAGEGSVRAALHGCALEPLFVRQATPEGSAAAALLGASHVEGDFLVIHGDIVSARTNLHRVLTAWMDERLPALALVQPLRNERPQDWIVAHVGDGVLNGVEGHARAGTHRLAGIYALSQEAVPFLRDNPGLMTHVPVGGMPPLEAEIAESLQMMLDARLPVGTVETGGYLVDLDKPWHILEANYRVI